MLLVPSYWSPGGSRSVTESAYGWFGSHRQCATWLLNYSATDIHGCPKMYVSMGLQPESFDHSMFYHPFSTKIPSSGSPVHHWPEILVFTAHQSAEVFRHSRFWRCWIAAIGSYPRRCSNRDTAPGRPLQGARGCSGATTVTPSSSFFYVPSQHPKAMNDRESHHRTVVWKLARAASQSTSIMQLALQYCIQEIVGMQCSN